MSSPEPARRGGGNLIFLGVGQLFRLGSGLVVNVLLMRALGIEGFGVYGTIMTVVGLVAFGSTMGMERLINRELARDPDQTGPMVAAGLAATAGLSLLTGLAVLGWAALVDGREVVVAASALAALALGLRALSTIPEAAVHARSRMGVSELGQVVGRVVLVAATALALWQGMGLVAVFLAQVLDAAATLVIVAWGFWRQAEAGRPELRWDTVRDLVHRSLPFGLNLLFGAVYLSVDVLLLAILRDDREVGIYRGAVMLIALFPIIANTLTRGLFPRMATRLGQRVEAGQLLGFASRVLLAVSLPAAVGGMLVAGDLMVFVGGEEYAVSAVPFVVMAPLLPLRFLNNGFAMALSALDRQEDRTRGVALAAGLNLVANLALIPAYGATGAAATTLFTEVALLAWNGWRVQPLVVGMNLGGSMLRVAIPAALMGLVLLVLPPVNVLLAIAIGVGVYTPVALLTGAVAPADLRRLRRI